MHFPPTLIWGVFLRLLGLVYLLAFASLSLDAPASIGARGVLPIAPLLSRIRQDFPSWRRFVWFPTLLWLGASDRRQRLLLGAGVLASLAVMAGIESRAALVACWLVLLSFDTAYDMAFPWECALFEAGFLALMLPALTPLPSLEIAHAPLPVVAWACRFLVARILFGFGKTKFTREASRDPVYLKSYMLAQPLPTPAGYFAFHLPAWVHRAALAYMALGELVAPFLIFAGPLPRLAAAGIIASLMVGIQLTGNYGYFNVLIIVLCVPLLDAHASLFDRPLLDVHHPAATGATIIIAFLAVGWVLSLLVNNWVTRNWLNWPGWHAIPSRAIRWVAAFYRALSPFRVVHGYGIFPPRIGPPLRWLPVIEGSDDGEQWVVLRTPYQQCDELSRPRFFAPRFPRMDHGIFYEGGGLSHSGFVGPLISSGHRYRFDRVTTLERLATRLLEPNSPVATRFAEPSQLSAFAGGAPRFVRIRVRSFTAAAPEDRARGRWWQCEDAGVLVPPMSLASRSDTSYPTPEFFAWDEIYWRRRAPVLDAAHAGIAPADDGVDKFWSNFFPEVLPARDDWSYLATTVKRVRARFTAAERNAHERTFRLLIAALGARLEPHFLGTREPRLIVPTWFDVGMLASAIVAHGRDSYEEAMRDPASVVVRANDMTFVTFATFEQGMLFEGIFRYETLAWHVRAARRNRRAWGDEPLAAPTGGVPGSVLMLTPLVERFPLDEPEAAYAPVRFEQRADGVWAEYAGEMSLAASIV
ncbi:MAG TPA: lipase maturation factor family protein [Gemmatimonadaceae bacterium]|nr:lipase maturation factor family protein [Gemmatimonadaceae bacterium]